MIRDIINVTESNHNTYNSTSIRQFTWSDDPEGTKGLLYVEFIQGGSYVYVDVPQDEYNKMKDLAYPENQDSGLTSGKYLKRYIVSEYDSKGEDYERFEDILDENSD